MKKNFLMVVFMMVVLFAGCGKRQHNVNLESLPAVTNLPVDMAYHVTESTNVDKAHIEDYQVCTNVSEIIKELDEEPDFTFDSFSSIEMFEEFCSSMSIPKVITDIYDSYKDAGNLNDKGEVEFIAKTDNNGMYRHFVVYQDDEGMYRISYIFETYNVKEVIGQGCFRNGDDLVIISLLT